MPTASSARLKGDDYQHLYTWHQILGLRKHGPRALRVGIEIPGVGAVDDVATWRLLEERPTADYSQVKFHVDQRALYTTDLVTASKQDRGQSLLQKLYGGWRRVSAIDPDAGVSLVTNWGWDPSDAVGPLIDGRTCQVAGLILPDANAATIACRACWQEHLGASDTDLASFVGSLRLITGFSHERKLSDDVAERMASIGLKDDEGAIAAGVQQVREWIKNGEVEHEVPSLEAAIARYDLRARDPEPFAVVHLHTIQRKAFADPADFSLDWVDLFEEGMGEQRGHLPLDPAAWNGTMLPELLRLRATIDAIPDLRLLKMRGQARLSAWIAAGFVFRQVADYELEARLGPMDCRTDLAPAADFDLVREVVTEGLAGPDVAVGISVTNDLTQDVLAHLRQPGSSYGAALFLRPDRPFGSTSLRGPGDVVALAESTKQAVQRFVRDQGAQRLGLFYLGPFSGALFVGHRLNAVAREIQVFEDAAPGYAPSFLLRE